jgi:hypothetical protein
MMGAFLGGVATQKCTHHSNLKKCKIRNFLYVQKLTGTVNILYTIPYEINFALV